MAAWVRLTRNFDWRNGMRFMKSFPVGDHYLTDSQADEAERVGAGDRLPARPSNRRVAKDGQTVKVPEVNPVSVADADDPDAQARVAARDGQ